MCIVTSYHWLMPTSCSSNVGTSHSHCTALCEQIDLYCHVTTHVYLTIGTCTSSFNETLVGNRSICLVTLMGRRRFTKIKFEFVLRTSYIMFATLTLYRMVMPIGTPFLKEKINN